MEVWKFHTDCRHGCSRFLRDHTRSLFQPLVHAKNQCVLKRLDVMCASTRSSPDRLAFLPNSTNGSCAVEPSARTGAARHTLRQVIILTSRENKTIEVLQQLPSRSVSLHIQYFCFYVFFLEKRFDSATEITLQNRPSCPPMQINKSCLAACRPAAPVRRPHIL